MNFLKLLSPVLLLVLIANVSLAESPAIEKRVQDMFNSIRSSGSIAASTEFVHWPSEYSNLDADARQQLGVNSPEELKSKMVSLMKNPTEIFESGGMLAGLEKELASVPEAQREVVKQMMKSQLGNMQQKMEDETKKYSSAQLSFLDSGETGDRGFAKVKLTGKDLNEIKNLKMIKADNQWYVDSESMSEEMSR